MMRLPVVAQGVRVKLRWSRSLTDRLALQSADVRLRCTRGEVQPFHTLHSILLVVIQDMARHFVFASPRSI